MSASNDLEVIRLALIDFRTLTGVAAKPCLPAAEEALNSLERVTTTIKAADAVWDAATFGNLHRLSNKVQELGEALQQIGVKT